MTEPREGFLGLGVLPAHRLFALRLVQGFSIKHDPGLVVPFYLDHDRDDLENILRSTSIGGIAGALGYATGGPVGGIAGGLAGATIGYIRESKLAEIQPDPVRRRLEAAKAKVRGRVGDLLRDVEALE